MIDDNYRIIGDWKRRSFDFFCTIKIPTKISILRATNMSLFISLNFPHEHTLTRFYNPFTFYSNNHPTHHALFILHPLSISLSSYSSSLDHTPPFSLGPILAPSLFFDSLQSHFRPHFPQRTAVFSTIHLFISSLPHIPRE